VRCFISGGAGRLDRGTKAIGLARALEEEVAWAGSGNGKLDG
jgi:hypothetical protein